MKLYYLFKLIKYFVVTEIISGIEIVSWFQFRNFFISLMNLENDKLGIKYAIPFILILPLISAIIEYQTKEKKISEALSKLIK